MKKILAVIGAIVVLAAAALIGSIALYAPTGKERDASSKAYANYLLDSTLKNWDATAIRAESSDELLKVVPDDKLSQMLQSFSAKLGPIVKHGEPKGESGVHISPGHEVVTAEYVVPVTFQNGEGQVALRFIMHDEKWKLLAVNVNSGALVPFH